MKGHNVVNYTYPDLTLGQVPSEFLNSSTSNGALYIDESFKSSFLLPSVSYEPHVLCNNLHSLFSSISNNSFILDSTKPKISIHDK